MEPINWGEKVVEDYRDRILVDQDNPILAFKANRDRFTDPELKTYYAGFPYLGSPRSEDALTWNVFRSLQKAENLGIITDILRIGNPRGLLLWTLASEVDKVSAELQYIAGSIVRKFDGRFRGQTTEPDVIILGTRGIAVIECKLGEPDKALTHLWEGTLGSLGKRLPVYRIAIPNLVKEEDEELIAPVYQLVRMAFYSLKLAEHFNVDPVLVALSNERNWESNIRRFKLNKTPAELWESFKMDILGDRYLRCEYLFWQDIREFTKNKAINNLYYYLSKHPCLAEK